MMSSATHILRLVAAGLFALIGVLGPVEAKDKKTPKRNVGISVSDDDLLTSFSYRDAFTKKITENLQSGLPTRLVIQISLEKKGKKKPVSYWARTVSVVYDLWAEVYIITVEDNRGRRRAKVSTVDEVIDLAGKVSRCQIADVSGLAPGPYRLRTLIEVNPVSKEMIENIRRWLAQKPEGSSTGNANFFGSFVGIFVDRQIGKADYTSAFISQDFPIGEP
jgi:hypothetical protein